MDKKIIIANLKMNPTNQSEFFELLAVYEKSKQLGNVDFVVAPPFIYIEQAVKNGFVVASQDCSYEDLGPHTGEVSPLMLKELGAKYVIIGHSERRAIGETDEMIKKKFIAVLRNGLTPILCIGETKEQKLLGQTEEILERQIGSVFENWKMEIKDCPVVIAYEPVWSISTNTDGQIDTPENASRTILFINKVLDGLALKGFNFMTIYGGSVNKNNIVGFLKMENIKGALVGGASLKKDEFATLLEVANSLN